MKKYGFGVDVGGTSIKIGLFLMDGTLIEKWELKTNKADHGAHILEEIAQALEEKQRTLKLSRDEIQGIGIGVPGPVMADGIVKKCVNLGWGYLDVKGELETLSSLPVLVANDGNIAALGEMWKGSAKGSDNVFMFTLGTGIGGGIIIDGHIINGAFGAAGEIGHIPVNHLEKEVCNCGKKGCLEQYASATGILRMCRKKLEAKGRNSLGTIPMEQLTTKDIFDAAKKGDFLAKEQVEETAKVLSTAMAVISGVVDPGVFVIGGGVSKAGKILIDAIQKHFVENAFHASKEAKIVAAQLGNDAGIYGAVFMLTQSV